MQVKPIFVPAGSPNTAEYVMLVTDLILLERICNRFYRGFRFQLESSTGISSSRNNFSLNSVSKHIDFEVVADAL